MSMERSESESGEPIHGASTTAVLGILFRICESWIAVVMGNTESSPALATGTGLQTSSHVAGPFLGPYNTCWIAAATDQKLFTCSATDFASCSQSKIWTGLERRRFLFVSGSQLEWLKHLFTNDLAYAQWLLFAT
jgi:hypothetical protein